MLVCCFQYLLMWKDPSKAEDFELTPSEGCISPKEVQYPTEGCILIQKE